MDHQHWPFRPANPERIVGRERSTDLPVHRHQKLFRPIIRTHLHLGARREHDGAHRERMRRDGSDDDGLHSRYYHGAARRETVGRGTRGSGDDETIRGVLAAAWGKDASTSVGRRMTLYRDPEITFGRDKVGGIRISRLSHIDKRLTLALTVPRGKRPPFVVEPLQEPAKPPPVTPEAVAEFERDIANATTPAELDTIAADLKTWDLGSYQTRLQDTWRERRAAIKKDDDR